MPDQDTIRELTTENARLREQLGIAVRGVLLLAEIEAGEHTDEDVIELFRTHGIPVQS